MNGQVLVHETGEDVKIVSVYCSRGSLHWIRGRAPSRGYLGTLNLNCAASTLVREAAFSEGVKSRYGDHE
jgi:hypothetical protein